MRTNVIIIVINLLFVIGCQNSDNNINYEETELEVLQEIINTYLNDIHFKHISEGLIMDAEFSGEPKPNIDSLRNNLVLQVYISDGLTPISQEYKDETWMFEDNYTDSNLTNRLNSLINSKRFNELGYRKIDRTKFKLDKLYRHAKSSQPELKKDEEYAKLRFSRICFDPNFETGVIAIDYGHGVNGGIRGGYHMAFLIEKKNGKWKIIYRH
ncbi:MAG: hypothetical protein N4A41_13430 [Crocinitomicaceae bacterium]|jgi:hypothetical protein|nr:hypothetical protein [Crocinitomicaceae bacterium]